MEGVGQNLQDHPGVYGFVFSVNNNVALTFMDLINPLEFIKYLAKGIGMFHARRKR